MPPSTCRELTAPVQPDGESCWWADDSAGCPLVVDLRGYCPACEPGQAFKAGLARLGGGAPISHRLGSVRVDALNRRSSAKLSIRRTLHAHGETGAVDDNAGLCSRRRSSSGKRRAIPVASTHGHSHRHYWRDVDITISSQVFITSQDALCISVAAQQLGLLLVGPMRRCLTSHRRRCRLTGGDGTQEGNTIPDSPPLPKSLCISLVNPLHPVPRVISPTRSTTNTARRPVEKTPPALVPSRFGSEIHSINPVVACLPVDPPWSLAIESRLRSAHGYFGRRRKPRYTCWICRQPSAIG